MWTLTGFADEVSPEFAEQLALLGTLGIRHLESAAPGAPRSST